MNEIRMAAKQQHIITTAGGCVLLTFDDGRSTVYTNAFPYMQARGLVATSYVTTNFIGTAGYTTAAQLQEMDAAGWSIGNHTMSHPVLPDLGEAEQIAEINGASLALEALSIRAARHHAYPFGQSAALTAMIAAKQITGRALGERGFAINDISSGNLVYGIPSYVVQNTTTLATVQGWVNTELALRQICSVLIHGVTTPAVDGYEWSDANFQAFIDWCISSDIAVIPIEFLYQEYLWFMSPV